MPTYNGMCHLAGFCRIQIGTIQMARYFPIRPNVSRETISAGPRCLARSEPPDDRPARVAANLTVQNGAKSPAPLRNGSRETILAARGD
jgi:hypothetical protein